jgi:5-formyltetrahydrofolate cyclo-ligase
MANEFQASRCVLRAKLIAAREAMNEDEHCRASAALGAALADHLGRLDFRVLGAYWPHRREFDPTPVLDAILADGRQIALPVVTAKGQPLEFRLWRPGAAMSSGVHGIPHPADGPAVAPDVILAPMVGFDRAGYRLGYGGGYYDRTLAAIAPRPVAVGVGFEFGRLETIDPQPHDLPMDAIVTEAGSAPSPAPRQIVDQQSRHVA